MRIETRKATLGDLEKIQQLNYILGKTEREKYDRTIRLNYPISQKGKKYFKSRIMKDGCAFVSTVNGKVIGYLVGSVTRAPDWREVPRIAELENMLVLEGYRGLDIGTKLYSRFLMWCRRVHARRIKVVATAQDKRAIKFYHKKGFKDYELVLERKV